MSHIEKVKDILPQMKAAVADRLAYENVLEAGPDKGSPASLAQAALGKAAAAVAKKLGIDDPNKYVKELPVAEDYDERAIAEVLHEAAREELHAAAFEAKSGRELEKSAAVKLQEAAELWDKVLEHPEGRCAYKYCRKDKEGNMLRCLPGSIACERLEPGQTS
eukprot:jgi/Chrzof1/1193/Cz01g44070.t1